MTGIWASCSGRLWRDAVSRVTAKGHPMTNFQILVQLDQAGTSQMVGCAAFRAAAETAKDWKQNDVVTVEGYLTLANWTDATGKPRTGFNLKVVNCHAGFRKDRPAANDTAPPSQQGAA